MFETLALTIVLAIIGVAAAVGLAIYEVTRAKSSAVGFVLGMLDVAREVRRG